MIRVNKGSCYTYEILLSLGEDSGSLEPIRPGSAYKNSCGRQAEEFSTTRRSEETSSRGRVCLRLFQPHNLRPTRNIAFPNDFSLDIILECSTGRKFELCVQTLDGPLPSHHNSFGARSKFNLIHFLGSSSCDQYVSTFCLGFSCLGSFFGVVLVSQSSPSCGARPSSKVFDSISGNSGFSGLLFRPF